MYGGNVKVAKSRKTKRKPVSEAEYLEGASEQPTKKAKKAKKDKAPEATGSGVASIEEEVEDLEDDKILPERTRSGKVATTSMTAPEQPAIPKRKRKHVVRKVKESKYVEEEESAEVTELVAREVRRKKVNDDVVQRVVELARQIEVPGSNIAREDVAEAAQQVIEAAKVVQELAATEAEILALVRSKEAKEGNAGTSEAPMSLEAPEGMADKLHTEVEIVELGSSSFDTRSNSPSSSSSTTSSDEDDIPLSKVYSTINKTISPSPSTKTTQNPDNTFVPMYPSVEERLIGMQQRRIDACKHLPTDHPLQPPVIEPIQFIPADAEGGSDHVGTDLASETIVSSKPNSPTIQNIDIPEPSILSNLESHYSGELPESVPNQQIASDITSDEVMTKCPQHQTPNSGMATSTNNNYVPSNEILVPELTIPEQINSEQSASEQNASELTTKSQSTTTNFHEPENLTNDQPSSSNLAIQPIAPAKIVTPRFPNINSYKEYHSFSSKTEHH